VSTAKEAAVMRHGLSGRLLIAAPRLGDTRFEKSVVYMCAHDRQHAMGLVVNKTVKGLVLPDLLDQLGVENAIRAPRLPILRGGPVEKERGFVLHSDDYFAKDATHRIADGVSLTATKDVLAAIASIQPPLRATLALGYAGWSGGQLEQELKDHAWFVAEADPETVFGFDLDTKWPAQIAKLGIDLARYSTQSGRA
jgi:putative transcriptional regulator